MASPVSSCSANSGQEGVYIQLPTVLNGLSLAPIVHRLIDIFAENLNNRNFSPENIFFLYGDGTFCSNWKTISIKLYGSHGPEFTLLSYFIGLSKTVSICIKSLEEWRAKAEAQQEVIQWLEGEEECSR